MQDATKLFYSLATQIGCHAFIEQTGIMNEYIVLCRKVLEEGKDFTQYNIHTGRQLPASKHNAKYIQEKLRCIFGACLDIYISMPEAPLPSLFGTEYPKEPLRPPAPIELPKEPLIKPHKAKIILDLDQGWLVECGCGTNSKGLVRTEPYTCKGCKAEYEFEDRT